MVSRVLCSAGILLRSNIALTSGTVINFCPPLVPPREKSRGGRQSMGRLTHTFSCTQYVFWYSDCEPRFSLLATSYSLMHSSHWMLVESRKAVPCRS